jgi:hypothetical protein
MKNDKKNPLNEGKKDTPIPSLKISSDLRADFAVDTISLFVTILLLYIINSVIYYSYHPDVNAALDKVLALSIAPRQWFAPEPVERMQFEVSVLLLPFIIYGVFTIVSRKRQFFYDRQSLSAGINYSGLAIFVFLIVDILSENIPHIKNETNAYFFRNNLLSLLTPFIAIILYCVSGYLLYLYYRTSETPLRKKITSVVIYILVAVLILDIILYNIFNLAKAGIDISGETNAVFYVITQVYAGKSLLVDINCQYGLFAWLLNPVFKVIGLSTYNMGMVMALLDGVSFLLIYLGIKKLIRNDLFSFIVFICLIFWQYWQLKLPFGEEPRFYYQYWPIRLLFPALSFYLIVSYIGETEKNKKRLLPVLGLVSSFAILWNLDTGIVVYGATAIALLFAAFYTAPKKEAIKQSMGYAAWMLGSLLFVLALFFVSTKMHAGVWPDLMQIFAFQKIFYISGFFMMPMVAVHFWNLPVIVYIAAGVYCVYHSRKENQRDLPVIVFLFILGIGLFAYFQGRSFDTTIDMVMYPAIIILGIFCHKLFRQIAIYKPGLNEVTLFLLVPFIFIADGAFSMVYYTPSAHSFAWNNATVVDEEREQDLAPRLNFVKNNLHPKDTVLILSKNYEGYYYAAGQYYNPLHLPGSTEILFKSEIDTLLNFIKTTKYPIVLDAMYVWPYFDTILETIAKYTTIQKTFDGQFAMFILKPGNQPAAARLAKDDHTLFYNDMGGFNKCYRQTAQVSIPDSFSVEFYCNLDTNRLRKDNIMLCTVAQNNPFSGFLVKQDGDDLTQYKFAYGNGSEWCKGVICKLSCTSENHIVIKVRREMVTGWNNNILCGEVNTGSSVKNNNGIFYINPAFSGTVNEIKMSSVVPAD